MDIRLDMKRLEKEVQFIQRGIIEETHKEFIAAGAEAFERSMDSVPVLTGRLRQSGLMEVNSKPYLRGPDRFLSPLITRYFPIDRKLHNNLNIVLSYDTPYARRQHEEHQTRGKFLLSPCIISYTSNNIERKILKEGTEWAKRYMI